MIDPAHYGLVEIVLVFGAVAAFCLWELYSLRKYKRKTGTDRKDGDSAER